MSRNYGEWPPCPACGSTDGFDFTVGIDDGHTFEPRGDGGEVAWAECRVCWKPATLKFDRIATQLPSFIEREAVFDSDNHQFASVQNWTLQIQDDGCHIELTVPVRLVGEDDSHEQTASGEWRSVFSIVAADYLRNN